MKRLSLAIAVVAALALAPVVAQAQPAIITVATPPGPGGLICSGGFVYSFVGTDTTTGLNRYALGGSTCGATGASTGVLGHAYYPVTDGPNSVQFTSARVALDLESIDVEGAARFDPGDADTVGGAVTYYDAPGTQGERLEGRYEKNWRPFEGDRTRAIVNLPVTGIVENNSGQVAGAGLLSGGLEIPVAANWSLTPRAGIGGATGPAVFGGDGILGTVSLTSRYRVAQVSRGDLVIGNMISYTGDTAFGNNNVIFRNGVAYQWPLKHMMFGRQVSARVSYVNTYITGDPVGIDDYHELAINFGVRMREQDVRSRFELLRFGILYTHADTYDAVTATVGYRF